MNNRDLPKMQPNPIHKFFWINLERSVSRRQIFEDRLKKVGGSTISQRIDAIDGLKDWSNMVTSSSSKRTPFSSSVEIACTLSHLKAIKTAYDSMCNYAMIAEDDLTFEFSSIPLPETMHRIAADAPQNWNVIQVGVTALGGNGKKEIEYARLHGQKFIEKKWHYWGANCYIISRQGMALLMKKYWDESEKKWCFKDMTKKTVSEYVVFDLPGVYLYTSLPFGFEGINSEIHEKHLPAQNDALTWLRNLNKKS